MNPHQSPPLTDFLRHPGPYAWIAACLVFVLASPGVPSQPSGAGQAHLPTPPLIAPPERGSVVQVGDEVLIPGTSLYNLTVSQAGMISVRVGTDGLFHLRTRMPGATMVTLTPKDPSAFNCLSCQLIRYRITVTKLTGRPRTIEEL